MAQSGCETYVWATSARRASPMPCDVHPSSFSRQQQWQAARHTASRRQAGTPWCAPQGVICGQSGRSSSVMGQRTGAALSISTCTGGGRVVGVMLIHACPPPARRGRTAAQAPQTLPTATCSRNTGNSASGWSVPHPPQLQASGRGALVATLPCSKPLIPHKLDSNRTHPHLHHVLPLQHAIGVRLKAARIHGVTDEETEVGLPGGSGLGGLGGSKMSLR